MNFSDPKRAWQTVYDMVEASQPRARNRARINSLFNGDAPYTDSEAEENAVSTNVNFLEGTEIIHKARGQFANAFLKPGRFFTIRLDIGPRWKREEWGATLTAHINRAMKRSPRYFQALQDVFAGVVLHGIGPATWFKDKDWCPKAHGIDDVFVPSGTLRDLSNLNHFAVYTTLTLADLMKVRTASKRRKGWNMGLLNHSIQYLMDEIGKSRGTADYDAYRHPEAMEEDFKENSGFWASDSTPVLRCYDFYWLHDGEGEEGWRRKILVDQHSMQLPEGATGDTTVLFDGKDTVYGTEIANIMHCQFADGAVKPPFRYHSVRSLGYLLYSICHLQNRLRCKFTDAVFESMLWYFRNVTTGDEERIQKIDLHHLGIIPEGLQWVSPNERPVVDPNLVGMAMTLNRQLMSEHSSHFVQNPEAADSGREQTATEIMAKVNAANAMIGSMLTEAYTYEAFRQQEIARRFATLPHKDCVRVRELCMMDGVPEEVFRNTEAWEVIPERVLGSGNKTLEIAQADRLMAIKDTAEVSPQARRHIVRVFITANTDDPILANQLVPEEENQPTPAAEMATLAWGTLIDGKPVVIASPINPIEYIQTLLQLLDQDLQVIEQAGGNPPLPRVLGLANVIAHIMEKIQVIAVDEKLKPLVKQFLDALKNAGNLVKAYMQRIQEAMAEQQQQGDPEAMAKIQAMLVAAESKARIMEDNAAQKRRHAEMKFVQDEKRKNDAAAAEIQRKRLMTGVEIAATKAKTKADIAMEREKTDADIEAQDATTKAGIIRENISAANKPKPKPGKSK